MRPPPAISVKPASSEALHSLLALTARILQLATRVEQLDLLADASSQLSSSTVAPRPYDQHRTSRSADHQVLDFLYPTRFSSNRTPQHVSSTSFNKTRAFSSSSLSTLSSSGHSSRSHQYRSASTASASKPLDQIDFLSRNATQASIDSDSDRHPLSSGNEQSRHSPASIGSYKASHWMNPFIFDRGKSGLRKMAQWTDKRIADAIKESQNHFDRRSASFHSEDQRHQRLQDLDHLWKLYCSRAHKVSLSVVRRVQVAARVLLSVSLISSRKSSRLEYKLFRYLNGKRLDAISDDCTLFTQFESAKLQRSVWHRLVAALLPTAALALKGQPLKAARTLDETLSRLLSELAQNRKTDRREQTLGLSNRESEIVTTCLQVILDSFRFEQECRPSIEEIMSGIDSLPRTSTDTDPFADIVRDKAWPLDTTDPVRDCLAWLLKSPHLSLFGENAFRSTRNRLLRLLALSQNPIKAFRSALGNRSLQDSATAEVASLLLRSLVSYGDENAAIDFFEFLWTKDVPLSFPTIHHVLIGTTDRDSETRLATIIDMILQGRDINKGSRAIKSLPDQILRTIALFWADQGRTNRMERILHELRLRNIEQNAAFEHLANMHLAAARGDLHKLKQLLQQKYDLAATRQEDLTPGKKLLDLHSTHLLLCACSQLDDLEAAETYMEQAMDLGLPLDAAHFNLLIGMHVRRTNIDAALAIFEQMEQFGVPPNKHTYTNFLQGFTIRRDPEGAAHTMRAMVAAKVRPDRISYTALLNCYVASGLFKAAVDLFTWMKNHPKPQLRPTIRTCNVMLKAFVLEALPVQDVLQFVSNLRKRGLEPDDRTFALMMQSACDAGMMTIAEELFSEAERQLPSPPGSPPGHGASMYHFTIMIHGYLRLGDNVEAKDYFDEMRDRGLQPSAITWSGMIASYAKSSNEVNYNLARSLVTQLVADETSKSYRENGWKVPAIRQGLPYETMFNQLLVAQADRGEPEQVELTLESLLSTPSGVSLYSMTPLLDAYRLAGDVEKGLEWFGRMYELALTVAQLKTRRIYAYSVRRGSEETEAARRRDDVTSRNMLCLPLSIMIDMLSKAGRHREIAEIWAKMKADGFGFDSDNWNHLVTAMAQSGQLEEAFSVIEHILFNPPPTARKQTRTLLEVVQEEEAQLDQEFSEGEYQGDLQHPYEFDPLTMSFDEDPARAQRADAVSSPSRPPNRRHQGRVDDDPYAPLPFDRPPPPPSAEEGDGSEMELEAEEVSAPVKPKAHLIDRNVGRKFLRPLASRLQKASWYAHFETMEAISQGLAALRDGEKAAELLGTYRTAAVLLEDHERKVERMVERQREAAERSARDLIDGRGR